MSIELGLDRIRNLLAQFERYTRPTVHIAGTNGKGSITALVAKIFEAAGLKVGRFNSPHLVHPSDSIVIDSKPITKERYTILCTEVEDKNKGKGCKASSFEILTTTALLAFERAQVDVVVCEVGLGGRLDATNAIPDECILASVIASIALDHVAFLGPTPAAIAREKAGIIRRNSLVILGHQKFANATAVVEETAACLRARCINAPVAHVREWDVLTDGLRQDPFSLKPYTPPPPQPVTVSVLKPAPKDYKLLLSLHGDHQLENLGIAISVVHALRTRPGKTPKSIVHDKLSKLTDCQVREAFQNCIWPGRLSFHKYTPRPIGPSQRTGSSGDLIVLADGAHNDAAAEMLSDYVASLLSSLHRNHASKRVTLTYVLSLSHSPPKTPESVLKPLLTVFEHVVSGIELKMRVALVEFTKPEGMPWVQPVPLNVMASSMKAIIDAEQNGREVFSDNYMATEGSEDPVEDLKHALSWAGEVEGEHLVVVAGSLYLVADFYRLLEQQGGVK